MEENVFLYVCVCARGCVGEGECSRVLPFYLAAKNRKEGENEVTSLS